MNKHMDSERRSSSNLKSSPSSLRAIRWLSVVLLMGALFLALYLATDFTKQPISSNAQVTQEVSREQAIYDSQPVRGVQVLKPKQRDITYTIRLPATLSSIAQVTIHAKVTGYLKSIQADTGDTVSADQVLAVIDAPELAQHYQQARSTYLIKKLTYERLKKAWEENPDVIAKQDVDVAEAAFIGAKHAMGQLSTQLEYTKVRAPFSGMITARFVDAGALIQAATNSATQTLPLFTLMDMSTLRVYVNVPQKDVRYVRPGLQASIRIAELPGKEFHGQVARTTGALDPLSRTMLVEIHAPNEERQLQPGMFAIATLYLREHKKALVIPPAALIKGTGGNEDSVFVVEEGTTKQVPITTDIDDGVWVEVTKGLTGDEDVVVVGKSGLRKGQRVLASPYTLPVGIPAKQKL